MIASEDLESPLDSTLRPRDMRGHHACDIAALPASVLDAVATVSPRANRPLSLSTAVRALPTPSFGNNAVLAPEDEVVRDFGLRRIRPRASGPYRGVRTTGTPEDCDELPRQPEQRDHLFSMTMRDDRFRYDYQLDVTS